MIGEWWRKLTRRGTGNDCFDEELASHVEMLVEDNRRSGMTEAEARRAARLALGGELQTRELRGEARGWPLLASILQDLRYSARAFRRDPVFALLVTITLTLGVGINSGIFSFVAAEVLRSPVRTDPDSYLRVEIQDLSATEGRPLSPGPRVRNATTEEYFAFRDRSQTMRHAIAVFPFGAFLAAAGTEAVRGQLVSCNYFAAFHLERPRLGRLFQPEDCAAPGSAAITVLSEQIWRDQFGSDPAIVGTTVRLDDRPFTVAGVAPASFEGRHDRNGLWVPLTMQPMVAAPVDAFRTDSPAWILHGRLKPGFTHEQAQAELQTIVSILDRLHPGRITKIAVNDGARRHMPFFRQQGVWVVGLVIGLVTMVMLIACTNVAVLLLARGAARSREMAVRLSLGAGRARLFRQMLTESLLLVALPFVLSLYIAHWMPNVLYKWFSLEQVRNLDLDRPVFLYTMGAALVAGLFAGFAPALESFQVDLSGVLKGTAASGKGRSRLRPALVAAQVAMSLVLVTGAGLFLHVLYRLRTNSLAFRPDTLMVAPLPVQSLRYTPEAAANLRDRLATRVRALPSASGISFSASVPLAGGVRANRVALPGEDKAVSRAAGINWITPAYFDALGVRMLRGGKFTEADLERTNPVPSVVGRTLAAILWPQREPLGERFRCGQRLCEVVGVCEDTLEMQWTSLGTGGFYVPLHPREAVASFLIVRFQGKPQPMADALRNLVSELEPRLRIRPLTQASLVEALVDRYEAVIAVIALLGALALVLACVGVYGVVAFSVARRTKEIGIRMALGAGAGNVVGLVVRSGLRPVLAGLVVGVALAMAAAQLLQRTGIPLMGVSARDPVTHGAVALLLLVAAVIAMLGPARRATRLDPLQGLRQE